MKRLIATAAVLAALVSTASAQVAVRTVCIGRHYCNTYFYQVEPNSGLGKIVNVPQEQDPERDDRIAQWELYCQPQVIVDRLGVSRYVYAHEGCDSGRLRD